MAPFHNPETGQVKKVARLIKRDINDTELCFHVTVLPDDVRIHHVTVAGRDIFYVIDPDILRAAYEEFKHQFCATAA